jgi:hypothetical protein
LLVLAALAAPGIDAKRHGKHNDKDHHQKKHHHDDDDDDDYQGDYDALTKRLDQATSRLHQVDDELDERYDADLRKRALSLEYRVSVLEEANCDDDHWDCGDPDHECVSRLIVCDGVKDCRNEADEKHCDLLTKKGDHFVGEQVYSNCTEDLAESFDFTVTAVKVNADYPAFPIIRAVLHFAESRHDEDFEISLPTVGYYRYSTHKIVLRPPLGRGLGLVCDFDGHNDDLCVGDIMSEGSLTKCARYIFRRKDDDDDDDEEEEHHDDDKHDKKSH